MRESFSQPYRVFASLSFYSYSIYINVIKPITLLPYSFYALLNLFLFLCWWLHIQSLMMAISLSASLYKPKYLEYHFITMGANNYTVERWGCENMRHPLIICCAWYRDVAHVSLLSAGSLSGSIIFTYGAKRQCWSFIEKRNSFHWHLWCHALKLNDWNVRFVFFFKVVTPCIMHFQVVWYEN